MRAGKLRHRINIQTNTPSKNDYGDLIDSWATVETRWAQITPIQGKELIVSDKTVGDISHKVLIRGAIAITPKQRILFGSRVFEIISSVDASEEKDIMIEILCKEILS